MSEHPEEQVNPSPSPDELPSPIARHLPGKLHPVARDILALPSKDRQKLFKSFKQNPQVFAVHQIEQREVRVEVTRGLLPSADELQKYAHLGIEPQRFFDLIDRQQNHRFTMESTVADRQLTQSAVGQWLGFGVVLLGCGLAAYALHLGHPATAGSIAGFVLTGVAVTFVTGKYQEAKKRREKVDAVDAADPGRKSPSA